MRDRRSWSPGKSRAKKAELGHAAKAGLDAAPHVVRSFDLLGDA